MDEKQCLLVSGSKVCDWGLVRHSGFTELLAMSYKEHEEADTIMFVYAVTVFRHMVALFWFFKQQTQIYLSMQCTTVNPEIFARILFSRKALKTYLRHLKFTTRV